jgi:predicted DNA-binding protein
MSGMDPITTISIPPETLELLQATALANQCTPEEIIRAAIEAFLESDKEPGAG